MEQAQARFVNLSANSIIACSVLSQQVVANIFNDPDIFEQLTRDDLPRANHLLHDRREILETELENGASERVGFFECFGQRQNLQERSVNDWVEELAKASIYALPGSGRFSVA